MAKARKAKVYFVIIMGMVFHCAESTFGRWWVTANSVILPPFGRLEASCVHPSTLFLPKMVKITEGQSSWISRFLGVLRFPAICLASPWIGSVFEGLDGCKWPIFV